MSKPIFQQVYQCQMILQKLFSYADLLINEQLSMLKTVVVLTVIFFCGNCDTFFHDE